MENLTLYPIGDPVLKKFEMMRKAGVPREAVIFAMEKSGIHPDSLNQPERVEDTFSQSRAKDLNTKAQNLASQFQNQKTVSDKTTTTREKSLAVKDSSEDEYEYEYDDELSYDYVYEYDDEDDDDDEKDLENELPSIINKKKPPSLKTFLKPPSMKTISTKKKTFTRKTKHLSNREKVSLRVTRRGRTTVDERGMNVFGKMMKGQSRRDVRERTRAAPQHAPRNQTLRAPSPFPDQNTNHQNVANSKMNRNPYEKNNSRNELVDRNSKMNRNPYEKEKSKTEVAKINKAYLLDY